MTTQRFPRKPYDAVESTFVREEIRRGDFDDLEHRQYVNVLVELEHFITDGPGGFAAAMLYKRRREQYPTEFDILWRELGDGPKPGERTGDRTRSWSTDAEIAERQRKSREYRAQWDAVADGED